MGGMRRPIGTGFAMDILTERPRERRTGIRRRAAAALTARRVLLIDPDPARLERPLQEAGYRVRCARSLPEAWSRLRASRPDILLTDDAVFGARDGLCRQVRSDPRFKKALLVLLTRSRGLSQSSRWCEAGADACWLRTRRPDGLVALVAALLRRKEWDESAAYFPIGGVVLDPAERTARSNGESSAGLSRREFRFMELLLNAYPAPVSRGVLYADLYPRQDSADAAPALNTFVNRLRHKLPPRLARLLRSSRDFGYQLVSPAEPDAPRGAPFPVESGGR